MSATVDGCNRLVRPGVLVRVKRHARECAGVRFQEEGYRARVLGRVTSSRRKGDWWYVRELSTFNVRTALSTWCRVVRGQRNTDPTRKRSSSRSSS